MYSSESLAHKIKEELTIQKITQKRLLEECGLGINTLTKLSNGTDILVKNLVKIADFLNCSTDYLLGRDSDHSLSSTEKHILDAYNKIPLDGKQEILALLNMKVERQTKEREKKLFNSDSDNIDINSRIG